MLPAMRALGLPDDAVFALRSADATRDRNVVYLYWDYGGAYGADLERYIDSVIAGQPAEGQPGAQYSLGQLAWIHAIGLVRDDMARDMQALGVPTELAAELAASAAVHKTVLGIWKKHSQQHGAVMERYFDACLDSYTPGWPHKRAPAETSVDDAERPAP